MQGRKNEQPYQGAVHQGWSHDSVQASHEEALYAFGELGLFTLMWRPVDHEAGLVEHCSVCWASGDDKTRRRAEAYNQPTQRECPNCYGTTWEGGYRAQIIRPVIFQDRNVETTDEARGVVTTDTVSIETTGEFTMRKGDYLFRFDNTRFQGEEKGEAVLSSGFGPSFSTESFGGGPVTLHMEEKTTVAFLIPPTDPAVIWGLLAKQGPFYVDNLREFDDLAPNGYI